MEKLHLSDPGLIDRNNRNGNARTSFMLEGDVHCWNLAAPGVRVEMHSAAVFRISGNGPAHVCSTVRTPATQGKNYMTPSGLQRLQDEHRFLLTRERPAVTEVVAWAA